MNSQMIKCIFGIKSTLFLWFGAYLQCFKHSWDKTSAAFDHDLELKHINRHNMLIRH